jgi:hypothetical protein
MAEENQTEDLAQTPKSTTLPDTLGTVPTLLGGFGQAAGISGRGKFAREKVGALLGDAAKAEAEAKFGAFERDQGILQKTAQAEKDLATSMRTQTQNLERDLAKPGEFAAPEIKASDYAANAAMRMVTSLLLGGVARTSGMAQLQSIRAMQDAEDKGQRQAFADARLKFDDSERARKENNSMLKERFERMMKLLSQDRNAALVEAKLIEGNMGKGIIAAELRAGNYQKAYQLFQNAMKQADQLEVAQVKEAAKPAKIEQLPSGLEKTLEKVGTASVSLNRANQTRKPEFFGIAPSDKVAELIISGVEKGLPVGDIMTSLGVNAPKVNREAVEWWKDYSGFVSQVRNQLFGATLTLKEASDFRKSTISPATDPKVADDYFRTQIAIIKKAVERERKKGLARGVSAETLSAYLDTADDEPAAPAAPAAAARPNDRARIPTVNTKEEVDALPAGAEYIDAQTGVRGRKPGGPQ